MKTRKELKSSAKDQLKGRYWHAVGAYLLVALSSLFTLVLQFYDVIISSPFPKPRSFLEAINFFLRPRVVQSVYGIYVILMLATMPLAYGWIVYNLKLMRGKDPVLADLFTGYRHFIDIIALFFYTWLLLSAWGLGFTILGFTIGMLLPKSTYIRWRRFGRCRHNLQKLFLLPCGFSFSGHRVRSG